MIQPPKMAVKVDSCCGWFTTKTGSFVIGSFNAMGSFLNLMVFIMYLVFFLVLDTSLGVDNHPVFIVAYVFIGIGMLSSLLQFIFSIMLIKGVNNREPKWVRVYMFVGTVAVFFSLLSLILGSFHIGALIWAIILAVIQIYFLVVIYSEYKNILAEKGSEDVVESPSVAQKPVGFR